MARSSGLLLLALATLLVPASGFIAGVAGAAGAAIRTRALGGIGLGSTTGNQRRAPLARTRLLAKKKAQPGKEGGFAGGVAGEQGLRTRSDREEAVRRVEEGVAGLGGVVFGLDAETLDRIDGLLTELEECATIEAPARSMKLWGTWDLVFTNSPPMLKNKGLTGLGAIPFVTFKSLTQRLESGGGAESIELLTVPPFGNEVSSTLKGKVTALSPQVIEQTYDDVVLANLFNSQASSAAPPPSEGAREAAPQRQAFGTAVLAITFLSDELRVCRAKNGAAFLFRKAARAS